MRREFLINIVLLITINLLVKIVYLLGVEVEVQNTLGPEDYGLFLALFNFAYLFLFINDPGIHSYNVTEISKNPQELRFHLPRILGVKLVLGFVFLGLVLLAAIIFGYEKKVLPYLLEISVIHVLSNLYMYLRSNLSAIGRYRQDSLISALDKLLMIFIIGGMLMFLDRFELHHFLWGQGFAFLLSLCVALILLNQTESLGFPRFSFTYAQSLLKSSFPFALILLLMSSYTKLDGVMLERLLPDGEYQTGIYAASHRFMEAARMVAYLIAALLLPMFAATTTSKGIEELCGLGIRTIVVIGSTICIVGIVFRIELMSIYDVFDPQYHSLLIWHLLSFFFVAVSFVYGTLLTAKRKLKEFNLILLFGVLINIGLNYWLIYTQKAVGAAMATLITQAFVVVGQVILAFRIFDLKPDFPLIFRSIVYGASLAVVTYFIHTGFSFYWLWKVVVIGFISLFLSFLLGVIRKDMIFALLKK